MKAFKRIVSCVAAAAAAAVMLASCSAVSAPVVPPTAEKLAPLAEATGTVALQNSRIHAFAVNHAADSYYVAADRTEVTASSQETKHLAAAFDSARFYINVVEDNVATITESAPNSITMYVLNTAEKTGMKMVSVTNEDGGESSPADILPDEADSTLGCGTLTLDGQTLYFESRTSGEGSSRSTSYYCFDQNSTELRYYVAESDTARNIYKINELKTPADPALFVVPSDYNIANFDYSARLHIPT